VLSLFRPFFLGGERAYIHPVQMNFCFFFFAFSKKKGGKGNGRVETGPGEGWTGGYLRSAMPFRHSPAVRCHFLPVRCHCLSSLVLACKTLETSRSFLGRGCPLRPNAPTFHLAVLLRYGPGGCTVLFVCKHEPMRTSPASGI